MPISFPFFTIYRDSKVVGHPSMPLHGKAFSSVAKATAYMHARGLTDWEFRVINRFNVRDLADDLRTQGISGVCFDPHEDRTGGEQILVEELLKLS